MSSRTQTTSDLLRGPSELNYVTEFPNIRQPRDEVSAGQSRLIYRTEPDNLPEIAAQPFNSLSPEKVLNEVTGVITGIEDGLVEIKLAGGVEVKFPRALFEGKNFVRCTLGAGRVL